jgi:AraC family transcriptional regulator
MLDPRTLSDPAPAPGTVAALPEPLLTSRRRAWRGFVVELYRLRDIDADLRFAEHTVAVVVAGSVNVARRAHGKSHRRLLAAGDVVVTPAGTPRRWQHAGEIVVALLRLEPSFVQHVAGDGFAPDPARLEIRESFGTRDPWIDGAARQMLACLEGEGEASRIAAESLATQLAAHLLRDSSPANAAPEKPQPGLSHHKLRRAIEYIDENLRDDLTLSGIAKVLAMSPGHFAHAFRATTGSPPHRYVLTRRIERAKSLLRETDLPIIEIAHRIGCGSHSHFSVLFHRATGQTPRDFRSQA